jgi:hypothetical protein
MGTNKSSETLAEAAYLRSLRTTSQAEEDEKARQHDVHDIPAAERWSALAH